MEGELQPADEGPCSPKMCRQQRGPYGTLKTFQGKRRSTAMEVPVFSDGHQFTFHPGQPHPFHPHQRLQLHQTISSSSSSSQQHQHRFPCESRPSSRVPTSTSAAAGGVTAAASVGTQQRRSGGGTAEHRFSPGGTGVSQESPDCTYGISSGGVQTC